MCVQLGLLCREKARCLREPGLAVVKIGFAYGNYNWQQLSSDTFSSPQLVSVSITGRSLTLIFLFYGLISAHQK
jgi:hypothetical protein